MTEKLAEIQSLYPSTRHGQFQLWSEWIWWHYLRQKTKNTLKKIRAKGAKSSQATAGANFSPEQHQPSTQERNVIIPRNGGRGVWNKATPKVNSRSLRDYHPELRSPTPVDGNILPPAAPAAYLPAPTTHSAVETRHQKPTRQRSPELGDPDHGHKKAKIPAFKRAGLNFFKACVKNGMFTAEEIIDAMLPVQDEKNDGARTQEEGVVIDESDAISTTSIRHGPPVIPPIFWGLSDHEDNSGERMNGIEMTETEVAIPEPIRFTPVRANPLQPSAFESSRSTPVPRTT